MPKKQKKDYEQLGQMLVNIYESGYIDRNQAYKTTFIKGILGGLGGVIGATVVVALLLWVLSFFHHVPLVNRITDQVNQQIKQTQQK